MLLWPDPRAQKLWLPLTASVIFIKEVMIRFLIITSILFLSSATFAEEDKWKINPATDEKAKFGVYIPKDIYDAHKELDKMLTIKLKEEMKNDSEEDLIKHHFGLGRWMRNNWALWAGSDLSKWFNSHGISHPDDMPSIILDSYYHHLRNEPLGLEEKFKYYIRHWKIREKPSKFPCENGKVLFALSHSEKAKEYYYHIAKCSDSEKYIVYEYEKGWSEPTKQMLKRFEELKDDKGLISAPLVKPN
jgi:hypothetical protein